MMTNFLGGVLCLSLLATTVRCDPITVKCAQRNPGTALHGCDRSVTDRERWELCGGDQTRPCPVLKVFPVGELDYSHCGRCWVLAVDPLAGNKTPPLYVKVVGLMTNSIISDPRYEITPGGWSTLAGTDGDFNSGNAYCNSQPSGSATVGGTQAVADCMAEAKCREFVPKERTTCNCHFEEDALVGCGASEADPCVIGMEDAGPIGINQCNECYKLNLPGATQLHVKVVDEFKNPADSDDTWRMQISPYVYDLLNPPPRDGDDRTVGTCASGSALDIVYEKHACNRGTGLCPQRTEPPPTTTTTTTTEEPTSTSSTLTSTSEEPTSTTEEPTTMPSTTAEAATTGEEEEEPTTTTEEEEEPTTTTEEPTTTTTEEPTTTAEEEEEPTTTEDAETPAATPPETTATEDPGQPPAQTTAPGEASTSTEETHHAAPVMERSAGLIAGAVVGSALGLGLAAGGIFLGRKKLIEMGSGSESDFVEDPIQEDIDVPSSVDRWTIIAVDDAVFS